MKSLVWYSPKAFTAAGYTVPTTWDDLMSLSRQDRGRRQGEAVVRRHRLGHGDRLAGHRLARGGRPAAVRRPTSTTSGSATTSSSTRPRSRRRWTPLDKLDAQPDVRQRRLRRRQDHRHHDVPGRRQADPDRQVRDAAAGLVLRGAVAGRAPRSAPDGDVFAFYLPPISTQFGNPVEGGGEFVTAFSDTPEVQAVQTYLSTPEWASSRVKVATGLGLRQQRRRPVPLHRPDRQAVGEVPDRPERHVPVRRLGPDAGRCRLRARSGRR